MKPAPFDYLRPDTLDNALGALADHGDEAKILAGGQSLIPMMNFRLARPAIIIDIERIPDLDGIGLESGGVRIGAMARQADVLRSEVVRRELPLLVEALGHVGHHQIRTRGTVGGSLAHADPAAELPAVAVALDAHLEVAGPAGKRTIAAGEFFEGPYTTALADDEILTSVLLPVDGTKAWAFDEITRTSGDFAVAGIVAMHDETQTRLVGFGLGWKPLRLVAAERALLADGAGAAASAARTEVDPASDTHADADYRRDAIATLVERCVARMAA